MTKAAAVAAGAKKGKEFTLKWDPRVSPNEIGVSVKDGIVSLTGWVDSYTKKWAAEEAAHRVRGVKAVANDLEVRLPSSSERTDADIAQAAVRALEWDAFLPPGKVQVTVSQGWVTLKGEVEWQYPQGRGGARRSTLDGREGRLEPDHGQGRPRTLRPQTPDRAGARPLG